ncbi:hypothetical protein MRX96_055053 [Rhipicephalus microplus]
MTQKKKPSTKAEDVDVYLIRIRRVLDISEVPGRPEKTPERQKESVPFLSRFDCSGPSGTWIVRRRQSQARANPSPRYLGKPVADVTVGPCHVTSPSPTHNNVVMRFPTATAAAERKPLENVR